MAEAPFACEVTDGVALITLDRPERLNALTFEVYRALTDRFYALRSDASVRAVVLTGRGKGFCSGGDVEDIIARLFEQDTRDVLAFTRMTGELVREHPAPGRPVIAALNGTAAGAGAVIALACDLRVMSARARIALPVHQGGADRRRHGRRLPAAAARRAGTGHGVADAGRRRGRGDRPGRRPGVARVSSPSRCCPRRWRSLAGSPPGRAWRSR